MTSLAQFMEDALYGSNGYYSAGHAQTGTCGDYFTAPETGDAFGRLLAAIFQQWELRLSANPFHLIEVGAGEGRLTRAILKASEKPPAYLAIERSAARREKIRLLNLPIQIFSDFSELKNKSIAGVIFANELIDAFPVHRVRMKNGKLEEAYVGSGEMSLGWSGTSTPRLAAYFDRLKIILPEGYETEVNLGMADWVHDASIVLKRGLIVLIDYGRPAWDYYAEERTGGTLRGFKDHRVLGLSELLAAGSQADWTSDVDFTSLALDAKEAGLEPLAFMEMGTFLKMGMQNAECGVRNKNKFPSAAYSEIRTPNSAFKYLLHPDGLGAQFHVLILGKNLDSREWTFEHNLIGRLGLSV